MRKLFYLNPVLERVTKYQKDKGVSSGMTRTMYKGRTLVTSRSDLNECASPK